MRLVRRLVAPSATCALLLGLAGLTAPATGVEAAPSPTSGGPAAPDAGEVSPASAPDGPADDVPGDRPRDAGPGEPFTIAIIPDTQKATTTSVSSFGAQTRWLADHAERLGIAFVLHEGDVVDDLCDARQWQRGSAAIRTLEDAGLPYAIAPGNHDITAYRLGKCAVGTPHEPYDATFPLERARAVPGFGGSFDGTAMNTWFTVRAGGVDHLVLALQFGPSDAQLAWALDVVRDHPDHRAVLVTHDLIGPDGLLRGGGSVNTAALPSRAGQRDGAAIWRQLVQPAGTFVLTANGHVATCDGMAPDCTTTTGVVGRSSEDGVLRLLANYQSLTVPDARFGDSGFLRLVTFFPEEGTTRVLTYSPSLDRHLSDPGNRFLLTPERAAPFRDPGGFPAELGEMHSRSIITGYDDGTFRPLGLITRQAAVAMLYRARPDAVAGDLSCTARGVRSAFEDVPDEHPFCFAIAELARSGQVRGHDDGTFRPSAVVSRQAFAAFMFGRPPGVEATPFSDLAASGPLASAVVAASRAGVVSGYDDGRFQPAEGITRQAAAAMVARYYYHLRSPGPTSAD